MIHCVPSHTKSRPEFDMSCELSKTEREGKRGREKSENEWSKKGGEGERKFQSFQRETNCSEPGERSEAWGSSQQTRSFGAVSVYLPTGILYLDTLPFKNEDKKRRHFRYAKIQKVPYSQTLWNFCTCASAKKQLTKKLGNPKCAEKQQREFSRRKLYRCVETARNVGAQRHRRRTPPWESAVAW